MRIFLFVLALLSANSGFTQLTEDNKKPKKSFGERLFFSGGLGLTFGDVTYIDISPQVGYKITDEFGAGVGVTYIYYSVNQQNYKWSTSIYGGSIFARYNILEQVVLYSEYQILNVDALISRNPDGLGGRTNVPIWLVGGGYSSPPGSGLGFQLLVLWDLIGDVNSPYSNPVIRGGISVGF